MQLDDLFTGLEDMSTDELRERLTAIRNNRLQKPEKVKQRERTEEKKTSSAATQLAEKLSLSDIEALRKRFAND